MKSIQIQIYTCSPSNKYERFVGFCDETLDYHRQKAPSFSSSRSWFPKQKHQGYYEHRTQFFARNMDSNVYKSFYTSTRANSPYVNYVMTFPWGMSITFYYVSRSVDFLKMAAKRNLRQDDGFNKQRW